MQNGDEWEQDSCVRLRVWVGRFGVQTAWCRVWGSVGVASKETLVRMEADAMIARTLQKETILFRGLSPKLSTQVKAVSSLHR